MRLRERLIYWPGIMAIIISLVFAPAGYAQTSPAAQTPYFGQTGHSVDVFFVDYFTQRGGVDRFGYPITEAYTDETTGLYIQYFQRARLELHPANPHPYKIQLGLLGDELGKRTPPLAIKDIPAAANPSCHYFAETGHSACYQFLDYWKTQGGLAQFGYPISQPGLENGLIVQYFQRARLEWHPERAEAQRVQRAMLGKIYYEFAGLDPSRLKPVPEKGDPGIRETPRPLEVFAYPSVKDAIVARGAMQTAYIVVTDQLLQPLKGAAVTLVVHFPSGDQTFTMPATDAKGTSTFTFPAGKFTPGTIVSMEYIITIHGLSKTTRFSYLLWHY